tara:strand:+ start:592 stop:1563 length:972 start_codon:yes stop_codon:yes gene_type:complete
MSFNYHANGEYIIDKNSLKDNFAPVLESENLLEGFADNNEDPYIEEKLPCFTDINGINQVCSESKLTMPKSTLDGLIDLRKKLDKNKNKFNGKKIEDFTKEKDINEFNDFIENIDMVNSEIEIITDWNKNLKNRESNEPSEPSENTTESNEISSDTREILDKLDGDIAVIEQQIYTEEKNLTEHQNRLRELENKQARLEIENSVNTQEPFSMIENFAEEDLDSIKKEIEDLKKEIEKREKTIGNLKEDQKLAIEQAKEAALHHEKQNEEDDQLTKKQKEERKENESSDDIDDEVNELYENYIFAGGIVLSVLIVLILLYYSLR